MGTSVTINGNNFSATPSANLVRFGPVAAPVTAASATSLTVTVPAGASYQPITVTTAGLTAYSYTPFSTTFNDPGQFTATAFSPARNFATGANPQGITAMDFDGDGLTDIAVANGDDNTVGVYLNASTSGSASFTRQVLATAPSGYYPQALAAGDLDGDGKPDLVMANSNGFDFVVFQNTSSLGHISFAQLPAFAEPGIGNWVAIGDLNGDGKPDIAIAELSSNSISIFPNTSSVGSISFGTPLTLYVPNSYEPWAVAIGDFDQDGMPDLAITEWGYNVVSTFRNKGTVGGSLSFATRTDFAVGTSPQGLAVGDLDGDGFPEIVAANNVDNTLSILRNTTSVPSVITFAVTTQATSAGPYAVAIADLDGDGHPDIASASNATSPGEASVIRNTSTPGTITLAAAVNYATDYGPVSLSLADLDGNGTPDMAVLNSNGTSPGPDFSVLLNQSPNAPAITSFTPTTGATGTQVTITGVNLTGATAVSFGGVAAASFTVVSSTSITAIVSTGASGAVVVTTPNGTASQSTFTFNTPAAPPVLTSFQPASGTYGDTITIQGTSLTQISSVSFGSMSALSFTILSDTVITAIVGEGASGNVTVTASSNSSSLSGFTYTQPPALVVTGFSPASGATGATVTITGSGFLNTPYVTFGGIAASNVHVVNDSVLTATVAGGSTGYVAAQAFNGTDSVSGFTFIASTAPPPPVFTSFIPLTGATGAQITLNGHHLSSVTSVSFGDVAAASFQIVSDSVIVATVGNGATGEVTIANGSVADSLPSFLFATDTTVTSSTGTFQLVSFSASLVSDQPFLVWTTVNEGGIAHYSVERGVDGNNFTTIDTLKSKAAGGLGATYTYTDSFPKPGLNYYRIKAQDTAANYYYSAIQAVQLLSMAMPVYPNPVKYGFFLVDLPSITKPSVFQLANTWGMIVQTLSVPAGVAQQRINIPGLLPGTYRLSWTDGTRIAYQTILVLYK